MAGAMANNTVQVHLTRTCNLSCAHCYSLSGPRERDSIDEQAVMDFLTDARSEGYDVVSFSGGEPLLYEGFERLMRHARGLGMANTVVTNATLMHGRDAQTLLPLMDLLAISVDGPEEMHNRMRGSDTAFSRMRKGLAVARQAGIPFGIIHTVTRESLPHLPELAKFAEAEGAELFQIHPLGLVGAAAHQQDWLLDGETLTRTYLTGLALRAEYADRMRVHIDLFSRDAVRAMPHLVIPREVAAGDRPKMADVLNPLVLMTNGDVSPICHAMQPGFRMGNVHHARLPDLCTNYLSGPYDHLRSYCQMLWEQVEDDDGWPYFNWYEMLESRSYRAPAQAALFGKPMAA